jgi:hypothetical protein
MTVNENTKLTMDAIVNILERAKEELKKPNLSDSRKIDYMQRMLEVFSRRLSEAFEKVYVLMEDYEKGKELNKEMFQDMSWLHYDYNLAVGLLKRHVANHPNATEQDKQAAYDVMRNPPKEPNFPRRQQ